MALAVALALAPASRARAEQLVPADLQAKIILRALAYDRSLADGGGPVAVAVVYQPNDAASERQRDAFVRALEDTNRTVKRRRVRTVALAAPGLRLTLGPAHADAVYVCTGAESALSEVRRLARERKLRTLAASARDIGEVALVVGLAEGHPKIMINLAVAKEEGIDFEFELLQVAQVVR